MIKLMMLTAAVNSLRFIAFDNKAGWKVDANGNIVLKDGNPVWVDANGGENALEATAIAKLNGEARELRIAKEKAETQLAVFKDIDPDAARKAIETIKKIDAKKLIDAGEVDKVRDEMRAEFTGQLTEAQRINAELSGTVDNMRIDSVFKGSNFIAENVAMPRDFFEAAMRSNFKVKDGKIEAYDKSGNRVMSKKEIGAYADPEEALALLVDQHPQKETILKASGNSGSGNNGNGGGRAGVRNVARSDWEKLPPHEQAAIATQASKGEVNLV